ncbi:MAG: TOMM precursor leader peptide-binding protein [Bacteroidota bacterium]
MITDYAVFYDEEQSVYQIRTRSDIFLLEFEDPEKKTIFEALVAKLKDNKDISYEQWVKGVNKKHDNVKVMDVVASLKDNDLLPYELSYDIPSPEGSSTTNEYGVTIEQKGFDYENRKLGIIGTSPVAQSLKEKALLHEYTNTVLFDSENFDEAELEKFIEEQDFLIVDNTNWHPYLMEKINLTCIKLNKPWLYIHGINGIDAQVGPIYWGREWGCYNCLSVRMRSLDPNLEYNDRYEKFLYNNKQKGVGDQLPGKQVIYDIIASTAIYEAGKFMEQWNVPELINGYISFNMLTLETTKHTLLRAPLCTHCKPKLSYNLAPWLEEVTLS